MRTMTRVHTAQERREMRMLGDRRARVFQVQLVCIAAAVRTVVCEVIPLCGSAGWWVSVVCLLPGAAVYGLAALAMKRCGAHTLADGLRICLGQWGMWLASGVLGILLSAEGAASMTALVTMFTEGIGSEGTQLTMALLTLGALVCCLHRDGLCWGIWLFRRGMLVLALTIAGVTLGFARMDGLHPVLGPGSNAVTAALRAGVSMGWPFLLLLTVENRREGYIRPLALPVAAVAVVCLLVCLSNPCEVLVRERGLALRLLLPVMYLPPALRTMAHGLGMLVMLLGMASCAQLAAKQLQPSGREIFWLPYVLCGVLAMSQIWPSGVVWRGVNELLRWGVLPLAVLAAGMNLRRRR